MQLVFSVKLVDVKLSCLLDLIGGVELMQFSCYIVPSAEAEAKALLS